MNLPEIFDVIDAALESDSHLAGSEHVQDAEGRVWTRNAATAKLSPAGSTGIMLELSTAEQVVAHSTFAASPLSVSRIVRRITEHLTGYAA